MYTFYSVIAWTEQKYLKTAFLKTENFIGTCRDQPCVQLSLSETMRKLNDPNCTVHLDSIVQLSFILVLYLLVFVSFVLL